MVIRTIAKFGEQLEAMNKINALAYHNHLNCTGVIYLDKNGNYVSFAYSKRNERCQVDVQKRASGMRANPIVNNFTYYENDARFNLFKNNVTKFSEICTNPNYKVFAKWISSGCIGFENVRPIVYANIFKPDALDKLNANEIDNSIQKTLKNIDALNILICVEGEELHSNKVIIDEWELYKNVGETITCPITLKPGIKCKMHRNILGNSAFITYNDADSTDLYTTTRTESLLYSAMNFLTTQKHSKALKSGKIIDVNTYMTRMGTKDNQLAVIYFAYNTSNTNDEISPNIASDPFSAMLNNFTPSGLDINDMKQMTSVMKGEVDKFKNIGVNLFVMVIKPPSNQGRAALINFFDSSTFATDIELYSSITSYEKFSFSKEAGLIPNDCIPSISDIISVTVDQKEDPYKKQTLSYTNDIITSIMQGGSLPKSLLNRVITTVRHNVQIKKGDVVFSFDNDLDEKHLQKCVWVMGAIARNINYYKNKGEDMTKNDSIAYAFGEWFAIQCQIVYFASISNTSPFTIKTNPVYDEAVNFETKPYKHMRTIMKKVKPHAQKLSRDMEGLFIKYDMMSTELLATIDEIPTTALGAYFYLGFAHRMGELRKKKAEAE